MNSDDIQEALSLVDELLMADTQEHTLMACAALRRILLRFDEEASLPSMDEVTEELNRELAEAIKGSKQLPDIAPESAKRKKTRDVTCPTCKAKPGKPCVKTSNRGKGDAPLGTPTTKYHDARKAKAKEES